MFGLSTRKIGKILPPLPGHAVCRAAFHDRPLASLYRRGLTGEGLETTCADSGNGSLAALPFAFPRISVQRCRAQKIRNALDKGRKPDRKDIKHDLHDIMNAPNRSAYRRFADHRQAPRPSNACATASMASSPAAPRPTNES